MCVCVSSVFLYFESIQYTHFETKKTGIKENRSFGSTNLLAFKYSPSGFLLFLMVIQYEQKL